MSTSGVSHLDEHEPVSDLDAIEARHAAAEAFLRDSATKFWPEDADDPAPGRMQHRAALVVAHDNRRELLTHARELRAALANTEAALAEAEAEIAYFKAERARMVVRGYEVERTRDPNHDGKRVVWPSEE